MSDNINAMSFKQLRNEVQLLRDELAIMKRKYEDIIYNLDDDNFSSRIVKEKNNMRAAIEITAEELSSVYTKVEINGEEFRTGISQNAANIQLQAERISDSEEAYATLALTAEDIRSEVKRTQDSLTQYSTIEQTATKITAAVTEEREYTTNLLGENYYTKEEVTSEISISRDGILSTVSSTYQTQSAAGTEYYALQSAIEQNADRISIKVSRGSDFSSEFTTTADGFVFNGEKTKFSGVVYLQDSYGDDKFSTFYQAGPPEAILLHCTNYRIPIVIGDGLPPSGYSLDTDVFIGNASSSNAIATRGWVLENAGSGSGGTIVAVFG